MVSYIRKVSSFLSTVAFIFSFFLYFNSLQHNRKDLKDKWRTIKAPLIYIPRQQVLNFKTALFASNVNTFEYLRKR